MPRLTDRIVKSLPSPETGNKLYFDDIVSGFAARVTANDARGFVLSYRRKSDGLQRRVTIGSFPEWTTAAAREEAKGLKRDIDGGGDPVGTQREAREAPTVNDLCDRFIDEQLPKRRRSTQIDYARMIRGHIRRLLGRHKVGALTFADVDTLHRTVTKESGPYRANRVVALLSRLCSLAMQWHWRADNPCRGIEKNHEAKRKRYLTGAELERLSHALAEHDDPDATDIVRLLLLTGARRGEVLAMKWADVSNGTWTKPASTTKQNRDHVAPLSAPALAVLASREATREPGDVFVFAGRHGRGHRVEIKYSWRRLCRTAKLNDFRIHDLRHSFASFAINGGASLSAIGALLGHASPVTTSRYAHLADDHLREVANRVGALIEPKRSAKVVPMVRK